LRLNPSAVRSSQPFRPYLDCGPQKRLGYFPCRNPSLVPCFPKPTYTPTRSEIGTPSQVSRESLATPVAASSILMAIFFILITLVSHALAEQLAAESALSDNKAFTSLVTDTAVQNQADISASRKESNDFSDDVIGLEAFAEGAVSIAVLILFTVSGRSSLGFAQRFWCKVCPASGLCLQNRSRMPSKVVEEATPSSSKLGTKPEKKLATKSSMKPAMKPVKLTPTAATDTINAFQKARSAQVAPRMGVASGNRGALNSETDALAAAVRSGYAADLPRLLRAAQRRLCLADNGGACGEAQSGRLLLSALRVCVARHCFHEGLVAYDQMASQIGAGCGAIWSMLLYSAVEAGTYQRCPAFYERIRNFAPPSCHDYVNMVRYHSQRRDTQGLRSLLLDLRALGCEVTVLARNRGLAAASQSGCPALAEVLLDAAFDPCGAPLDAIGFNTLMKGRARLGQLAKCLELKADMERMGVVPSEVTFGILLDACVKSRDLPAARDIFAGLVGNGLQPNAVHYTTLIKGLVAGGCLGEATAVLRKMRATPSAGGRGQTCGPDIVTYSTLVKAHADQGDVQTALCVLEDMLAQGIKPDLIIFNAVLGGAGNAQEVRSVLMKLATCGLQASGSTLAIALRALLACGAAGEAEELLSTAVERLGVKPERRLFEQLEQAAGNPSQ